MTTKAKPDKRRPDDPEERYVIKDHCVFDTKQDACIGAGDCCEVLNHADKLAEALRPFVMKGAAMTTPAEVIKAYETLVAWDKARP